MEISIGNGPTPLSPYNSRQLAKNGPLSFQASESKGINCRGSIRSNQVIEQLLYAVKAAMPVQI
jgi:hypothetical protein